ncbi:MAG: Ig-like domain-containing protein [Mogibacterium sp.]|nr:Ig-like domain-containing protein [Mogibacterium sp.]
MRSTSRIFRIIIVALLALSISLPSFAFAADAVARPEVIYYEYDESTGSHVYKHSEVMYDGQEWECSADISDTNTELYVLNDVGQTYTSLDPDIVEITGTYQYEDDPTLRAGLNIKKGGTATIRIDIPAQKKYAACTLYFKLRIHSGRKVQFMGSKAGTSGELGAPVIDGETDKGFSFNMADLMPRIMLHGYDAEYSSLTEDLVSIDQDGWLTLKGPGMALIKAVIPADDKFGEETFYCQFEISIDYGIDRRYTSHYTRDIAEGSLQLDIVTKPGVELTYSSSDETIATVDNTGYVTFVKPGNVKIYAAFPGSTTYAAYTAEVNITITGPVQTSQSTDAAQAALAAQAAAQAAQNDALAAAANLTKPKLKCSKRKKRSNKLTWSRVAGATGYELYIKYPGTRKYVRALTKNANVKSVTHKGLTRRKKYSYKIRAFVEAGGVRYYGPFSKAIKVKAK